MSNPSNSNILPPFSCVNSPQLPELLHQLNCTLVISTYQAGKVIFINAQDDQKINLLPRSFNKAMGVALEGDKMAIATKDEVIKLVNSPQLAVHYPNQPGKYKDMFVPRATYYTGNVDMHDLDFGNEGLWGINTSFSCLCLIDDTHSFIPKWRPNFISALVSEDRCHLNGLVMKNGNPKYVTALGTGDTHQSWRDTIVDGGVLIDVETDEVILNGLAMPHSPQFHNNELYMLLSAKGEVIKVDIENKTYTTVKKLDGFTRGMAFVEDYLFVGMSKLRKNSSTFAKLPFAESANTSGVKVIHLPTQAVVGELIFRSSVDEIYDLKIIENTNSVGVLNTINDIHKHSLTIPGTTFWSKPKEDTII